MFVSNPESHVLQPMLLTTELQPQKLTCMGCSYCEDEEEEEDDDDFGGHDCSAESRSKKPLSTPSN